MSNNKMVGGWPLPWLVGVLGIALIGLVAAVAIASGIISFGAPGSPSPSPTGAAVVSPSPTGGALPTSAPSSAPSPTASAPPSALPSPTAAPTSGATPTESVAASPTAAPSASPTAAPSASPTSAPTAPPQSRFREVAGFPAPGEIVQAITAGGPGFVAVGYVDNPTTECAYRQDARIWSSPDGESWTRRDGDALVDTRLTEVIDRAGTLFALGYVGNEECPSAQREDFGNNVWRSADGITWEQITSGLRFHSPYDRWNDVTLAGDTFVVVGARGELGDEEPRSGVWTSNDAIEWTYAARAPRTYSLESVAALGSLVVAWGSDITEGLAWYSQDGGATWRRGSVAGGYNPYNVEIVAGNGQFVAVTGACCEVPTATVGVDYVSNDGATWRPGPSHRHRGQRGLFTPSGAFVALTDSPETRISTDGASWRSGPPGPSFDASRDFHTAAAAGPLGVIMTIDRGVGRERLVRAFFAPDSEFEAAAWTSPPEPSVKAVVGEAYRYELYTHCGSDAMRVVMDGSVWVVDEIVSGPFRDPGDRGMVTMTGPDTARYDGRRGGLILFRRTDSPPPWPRCA